MTKELLDKIKLSKKWPFKLSDIFTRYFFLFFPFGITLMGLSAMSSGFKNNVTDLKIVSILISSFGLFLFIFIALRLFQNQTFECFDIPNLTEEQIKKAIRKTNLKNSHYSKLGYFVCTTKVSWFSWGEEITIIPHGDKVLINSRPKGSLFSYQPITFFKDKRNVKIIIEELRNA